VRTRTFVVIGLLATLLVAGVASYYASSHPDGLEYVAEQAGFADTAEDSAAADSPLSDYQVKGVENDAVSGGLAGVIGALVVLLVAGGLVYLVRRKGSARPDEGDDPDLDELAPRDAFEARQRERG
jgi:cobalt/nickel transport system permease protein/cobalt/nickel transport protein